MHISGLTLVFGALFSLPFTGRYRSDIIQLMYENSYIEEEYAVEEVNAQNDSDIIQLMYENSYIGEEYDVEELNARNELLIVLAENRRLRIELHELRENQRLRIEHNELREELMYYETEITKAEKEILFYQVGIVMSCMMFIILFFLKNY